MILKFNSSLEESIVTLINPRKNIKNFRKQTSDSHDPQEINKI